MATPNYTPGGFTNLGSTPGLSVISKPQIPVAAQPNSSNGLDLSMFNKNLASGALSQATAPVKKIKSADGTEIHFDNTEQKTGNNPGMINNTNVTPNLVGGMTAEQRAAGDLRTQQLNSSAANTNLTEGNLPASSPQIDTSYSGLVGGTTALSQGNLNIGQSAKYIMSNYGKQIADVGQQGANYQAGALTTGTSPVGEGNAAINAAATAAKQTALAQGGQMALTGTGQQLTAQNQAQTGVLGAAGLVPEALRYGSNAEALNPLNNVESIAKQVISGQISPSQAYAMGGTITNFPGLLNQELQKQKPGFNAANAEGQFNANQSNTQVMGTALTNANAASIGTIQQQNNVLSAARASVSNLANNLLPTVLGLNPSDLTAVNGVLQTIAKQTSNVKYKTLNNQINDIVSAYGSILNPTGNTDTTRALAQSLIDGLAKGTSFRDVIQGLDQQAQSKIGGGQTTVQNILSGTNVNPTNSQIKPGAMKVGNATWILGTDGNYYPQ